MPESVSIHVDGKQIDVPKGTSVAAAVWLSGRTAFRHSVSGEPRAALCGMGICFECRAVIDERPHCRSCQIVARDGMVVRTT